MQTRRLKSAYRWSAILSLAALACGCGAEPVAKAPVGNPIVIQSVVPYQDADVGNEDLRRNCDWNRQIPMQIVEGAEGQVVIDDAVYPAPGGRKLHLSIITAHIIGGKGFTGPKWAALRGKLTQDGRLIGSFENSRATSAGSFKACGTAEDLGEELAEDVVLWLKHPSIDPAVKD